MVLSGQDSSKASPEIQMIAKLLDDKDRTIIYLTRQLQYENKCNFELDCKLQEISKERDDLKNQSQFVGMEKLANRLAHDLHNPISVIKNTVELLETRPHIKIEEKIIHYKRLEHAVNRIRHGIEDVLEYAVVPDVNCKLCKVTDIIALAMMHMTIPDAVKIRVRQSSAMINCDQKMMVSALSNLILNAVQAAQPEGTVDVKIDEADDAVSIGIEDSGPGIDDDLLEKVFEPLYTTKQVGIGLGLSVCKNIITKHGGTILLKNKPTTVQVILPKDDENKTNLEK